MTCRDCDLFLSCKDKNETFFNAHAPNFTMGVDKVCSNFQAVNNSDKFKFDSGKPRCDLVPAEIIEAIGKVRSYGVQKYGEEYSYRNVEPKRYRAALMRHICSWLKNPQGVDEESGLPHLWHVACNVAFLLELDKGENDNEHDGTD